MDPAWLIVIALLLLAAVLLTAYFVRLFRRSREIERTLDYSKMRRWEDEEDEEDR